MLIGVEHVVEVEVAGVELVVSPVELEVTAGASVVIVSSFSDKLSPTGMLISGMFEAARVLVPVGRAVGVPVATSEVPESSPPSLLPLLLLLLLLLSSEELSP